MSRDNDQEGIESPYMEKSRDGDPKGKYSPHMEKSRDNDQKICVYEK